MIARQKRTLARTIAIGLMTVTLAFTALHAQAGDRPLELVLVNMTPDEVVTPEARRCMREFVERLQEDDTTITRWGETELRTRAGHPGDDDFMQWPAEDRARITRENEYFDALVFVDCRPESRRLDVYVSEDTHLRIREMELNRTTIRLIGHYVLALAWVDFSP